MMYHAIVAYDGSSYYGFQRQNKQLGIQEVIEKALKNMTKQVITIHGAGRTDKGVHAKGQSFHFETEIDLDGETFKKALNKRLPETIRILSVRKTKKDFHARHSAKSKVYTFKLSKKPLTAFEANYEVYVKNLDFVLMQEASQLFIGTHNFLGFCEKVEGKPTVKTIYSIQWKHTKHKVSVIVHGNSFLKYMLRSMMGTLIEIGQHKKKMEVILQNLETPNRKLAGKTAPAKGLYLTKIHY
jgi:tRNA pseudouridine38-40 synthase